MQAALGDLRAARAGLEKAVPEKAGHRVKASHVWDIHQNIIHRLANIRVQMMASGRVPKILSTVSISRFPQT